jgi:AcrR family transcriptional regulator
MLRKHPQQARSRTLTEDIIQAAEHLLAKEPLARITTNQIAERAGVSVGSLYQYFGNKDQIVLCLAERHRQDSIKQVQAMLNHTRGYDLTYRLRVSSLEILHQHRRARTFHLNLLSVIDKPLSRQQIRLSEMEETIASFLADENSQAHLDFVLLAARLIANNIAIVIHSAIAPSNSYDDETICRQLDLLIPAYLQVLNTGSAENVLAVARNRVL